jgi:hypothetical protein
VFTILFLKGLAFGFVLLRGVNVVSGISFLAFAGWQAAVLFG